MELRITRTEENEDIFEKSYELAFLISVYKNPCLFWGIGEMPEAERLAEVSRLEDLMGELFH